MAAAAICRSLKSHLAPVEKQDVRRRKATVIATSQKKRAILIVVVKINENWLDTMPHLWQQNPWQAARRYCIEKLSALLSEMQAGNADRSGKLENNRYKEARNLISICTPPCMAKTIAAVFLRLSAVSATDFLCGFCCLPCSCNCLSLFLILSLSGGLLFCFAWRSHSAMSPLTFLSYSTLYEVRKNGTACRLRRFPKTYLILLMSATLKGSHILPMNTQQINGSQNKSETEQHQPEGKASGNYHTVLTKL